MAPIPTTIDPKVKVPEAVRRQAEAAQAAFNLANNVAPPVADPTLVPDPAAVVVPPAAPVAPVTPEVIPEVSAQEWQHRFNSMKGRFESSQNSVRTMSDQLGTMATQIAALQAGQVAPVPHELTPASLLTAEETNEYGAEFLTVVGKKALEQLSPEVAAIKKEMAKLQAKLEGTAAEQAGNARRNMEVSLDASCPTWREINFSQDFHDWLKLQDPFTGAIRHQLLTAAYGQNQTPQVLAFFNGFLAQEAALAPAPTVDPAPAADGKIPLSDLAAPGRAKTSAANAPVEKPTFTTAQIAQFYADSARGKYRGREAEYNRTEAQIFEAQREGRVR